MPPLCPRRHIQMADLDLLAGTRVRSLGSRQAVVRPFVQWPVRDPVGVSWYLLLVISVSEEGLAGSDIRS